MVERRGAQGAVGEGGEGGAGRCAHANQVRGLVLGGQLSALELGPRSAAELREAATYFERAAALCPAPASKANMADDAATCRTEAEAMLR